MKISVIVTISILIFLRCIRPKEEVMPTFSERNLGFSELRDGFDSTDTWIRKPENIRMVHETLKKIDYNKLLSNEILNTEYNWWIDVNKKPRDWIDSLVLTYNSINADKYYQEFWQRRAKEGNAETVYEILFEIQQILLKNQELPIQDELVNDTLYNLLSFEYPYRKIRNEEAQQHLKYLVQIGLHESAYNLISGENMAYQHINWNVNKDSIISILSKNNNSIYPWFMDDSK